MRNAFMRRIILKNYPAGNLDWGRAGRAYDGRGFETTFEILRNELQRYGSRCKLNLVRNLKPGKMSAMTDVAGARVVRFTAMARQDRCSVHHE